jgi:phage terminase large subunit
VLLSGPAGTGKSRACLEKLHAACLRWPGTRVLIVRKTRASLTESALVTFEEKVLNDDSPVALGPARAHRRAYRYPGGSEIVVGGMDRPGKVMSCEYDLIYVQEAIELSENDWEHLTTRLRNHVMPFQQIVADTNPDGPRHWLYRRCAEGKTVLLESRHEDNPTLWDRAANDWTAQGKVYIERLDALSGVRRARLRFGQWVQAEGLVYADWDRRAHLVDRFDIPSDWTRVRAIDFGHTHPFVCLWIALDGEGRMYVYRELYHTRRTVRRHAQDINRASAGESFAFSVADHDAEDRATLLECGIATVPANKARRPGVEAVQERLKPAGDGQPRLFVLRDSLIERDELLWEAKRPCCLIEEIDGYVWTRRDDGRLCRDEPVKVDDHALDALRYATLAIDRRLGFGPGPVEPPPAWHDIHADHWWPESSW